MFEDKEEQQQEFLPYDDSEVQPPAQEGVHTDSAGEAYLTQRVIGQDKADVAFIKNNIDVGNGDAVAKEASKQVLSEREQKAKQLFDEALIGANPNSALEQYYNAMNARKKLDEGVDGAEAQRLVREQAVASYLSQDPRTKLPEGVDTEDIIGSVQVRLEEEKGNGWAVAKDIGKFLLKDVIAETYFRKNTMNAAVDAFKLGGSKLDYYASTERLLDDVYVHMNAMSPEQQLNALNNFVTYARANGVTEINMRSFLGRILDNGKIERIVNNVFDIAGPLSDMLVGLGVLKKVLTGTRAAKNVHTKTIGDAAGGKEVGKTVADDVLNSKNTFEDEWVVQYGTKLSPENILPKGVYGTSSEFQQRLKDDVSKVLSEVQDRLRSTTVYDDEISTFVNKLKNSFDPTINPAVRSFDVANVSGNGATSYVTWATKDGTAFATKEAAEAFAKRSQLGKYTVIPDTSASGFLVKSDALEAYRKELKQLRTLLKPNAFRAYVGRAYDRLIQRGGGEGYGAFGPGLYMSAKTGVANTYAIIAKNWQLADPKVYYKSKVTGETVHVRTSQLADHGASPEEIEKLVETMQPYVDKKLQPTRFTVEVPFTDDEFLKHSSKLSAAHADALRPLIGDAVSNMTGQEVWLHVKNKMHNGDAKAAAEALSDFGIKGMKYPAELDATPALKSKVKGADNYVVYPRFIDRVQEVSKRGVGTTPAKSGNDTWDADSWEKALDSIYSKEHTHDNVFEVTNDKVLRNINRDVYVSKAIGKKQTEAFTAWYDMLGLRGQKLVIVTKDEATALASKYADMEVASIATKADDLAAHYVENGVHYIVTNGKVNSNDGLYTVAHEFGHMFHTAFVNKYDTLIEEQWIKWKSKNLPKGEFKNIRPTQFKQAVSFRAPTQIEQYLDKKWGDITPGHRVWLSDKNEWFAEQFAQWLLHDKIPRSQFEHLLKSMLTKLDKFAKDIAERLGIPAGKSPVFVKQFLNQHIIDIKKAEGAKLKLAKEEADLEGRVGELEALIKEAEDAAKLPTHGWLVKEERFDEVTYDSLRGFNVEDIESSFWIGIDPKHLVSEFLVEGRVVGVHAEAKLSKAISEFMIDAVSGLNKTEMQKVYGALKKGDAYSEAGGVGKEFNTFELKGMGLGDKEVESYFKLRTARNLMFNMKDEEYARAMRKQGFKQIGIDFGDGKSFVSAGKTIDQPQLGSTVYDARTKKAVTVDQALIDNAKMSGGKFVRLEEVYVPGEGGSAFKTFLVDADNSVITDIRNVLHYREGEFSRIYTDEYFITLSGNKLVDGVSEKVMDTAHTAATKAEAEAFVKGMNQLLSKDPTTVGIEDVENAVGQWVKADTVLENIRSGKYVGMEFNSHYNRIPEDYVTNFVKGIEGSLFTGRRGERLTSISENKENIMSITESLQAELLNTSRVLGRTDWREAAITRWYNEAVAADALPQHVMSMTPTQAFEWAGQANFKYVGSGKQGKFLERTHEYIRLQLGQKTRDEKMWETVTRSFSERYLTGKLEPVGKFLRQARPGAFLRTANFHTMLGFMNPSQLFVQSMGAVAAVALHPVHGVKAGMSAPMLRMALMSDNPEVWNKFASIKNFAELGFANKQDFLDTVEGIRRSGILDGIHSTSLYNIEDGAYNVFSGVKRNLGKASLWTFNRGEEMARIIAFDVARREWQAANKGMDFLTEEALKAILIRTDDFTQNMTRANEAFFQRGVLSIPAQFLQYQLKLYANIVSAFATKGDTAYRGFTRKEAIQIMAAHVVLFGVANNGLGSFVEEAIGDAADNLGLDADGKYALSQGAIAALLDSAAQAMTGEELKTAIGTRLSTFDWYLTFAEGLTQNNFFEVAAGPSYSWVRTADKVADVGKMWVQNPNLSYNDVVEGIKTIGESQISTWRNATKAYVANMHGDVLQSARGDDIAQLSKAEVIAQALGIAPVEQYELSKLNKRMRDHYTTLRELSNTIAAQQQRAITAFLEGDREKGEALSYSAALLIPKNAGDREFVLRNVRQIQKNNKGYNEAVAKYLMKQPDINKPLLTGE